jgi:N-acyl-D-amino-acid deacylase
VSLEETILSLKEVYGIDLTWRDIDGFLGRLDEAGTAINYATLVGHGTIRGAAMGLSDRSPAPEELEAMQRLIEDNMERGAFGLSSGLEYTPGSFARPEEIKALCRVVAQMGGVYATHMRSEGNRLLESMEETMDVGRETGVSLQISHFKVAYPANWGKIDEALAKLDSAEDQGLKLLCDRYPYIAGSTSLNFNFPMWAREGTSEDFLRKIQNPGLETRIREHLKKRRETLGSWDRVVITDVYTPENKKFEGKSIEQAVQETNKDAFVFMRDLLVQEKNRVGMVIFMMKEDNLKRILAHPQVCIGCDGLARAPYGPLGRGKPHPRSYGTFPRVLGKYVREEKILPMKDMIKKITSLPAQKFGFEKRGVLQAGYYADLVVFDEEHVADKATFTDPHQYPEGIIGVVVNGRPVVFQGEHTGALSGKVLRKIL